MRDREPHPEPGSAAPVETEGSLVVVGILGGIGSGKSAVARELGELGALVFDADRIAHRALARDDVRDAIVTRFGDGVLDDERAIDRAALGAIVFRDREALDDLEAILHPVVQREIEVGLSAARRDPNRRMAVIDAPLLLEAGLDALCDRLVFVDVDEETRFERIKHNRGWDLAELRRRESFQKNLNEKRRRADTMMDNNSSASTLKTRVRDVWQRLVS